MPHKLRTREVPGVAPSEWARPAAIGAVAFVWLLASSLGAQTYQTLHAFTGGSDGAIPHAAVIADAAGNLYGTSSGDEGNGSGTVFKLDAANDYALTTLHAFSGKDGAHPSATVIADAAGNLYGTTYDGGPSGYGTVFKLDKANDYALTTLHAFSGPDGAFLDAAVIADASGNLYGTTLAGGPADYGTVFRLDAANGYEMSTLHAFDGTDGRYPHAAVIADASGNLYGTTYGLYDSGVYGTVFKLDAANGYALTTLHFFSGPEGAHLLAPVIADAAGNLYGTTVGEAANNFSGTVFKLDASNTYALTTLHTFVDPDGSFPDAAVLADASGSLFGSTRYGGPGGLGVVYSLSTGVPTPLTSIAPASGPSSGGVPVIITGTGFTAAAGAWIGGIPATGVTVVSSTEITALTPPLPPGRLNDVAVSNPTSGPSFPSVLVGAFFSDFLDVPQADIFHADVEKIFRNGITAGCGGGNYCRNNPVTRAQTAVFLLKAEHGSAYVPPACTGVFTDVVCAPTRAFAADWIEQLSNEAITGGCGGGNYCPGSSVTRAQMAVLLLKAEHGPSYAPPACAGIFPDVACTPTPAFAVDWIEQLSNEGITGGCGGGNYCPDNPVSRGQMAAFLVRTFGLQ